MSEIAEIDIRLWRQLFLRSDEEDYAILQGGLGIRRNNWDWREENVRISLHKFIWEDNSKWKRKGIKATYNFFWLDFDKISFDEIMRRIREKGGVLNEISANFLVETGRGFHLIWSSEEEINDTVLLSKLDLFHAKISNDLGSDRQNIMNWYSRIPFTINEKVRKRVKWYLLSEKFHSLNVVKELANQISTETNVDEVDDTLLRTDIFNEMRVFQVDISNEDIQNIFSFCSLLQRLEKEWEKHTYREWYLMSVIYAVWSLIDKNKGEEFIRKSLKWRGERKNKLIPPELQLKNTLNYIKKHGVLYPSCQRLASEFADCKRCIYKKTKYSVFGIARGEKFRYSVPDGYLMSGGWWAKVKKSKGSDEEEYIAIANRSFFVEKIEKIISAEERISSLKDVEVRLKVRSGDWEKTIEIRDENAQEIEWLLELQSFSVFKQFVKDLIKANAGQIDELLRYSGINNFKENFLNKDYFTSFTRYKEIECETKGKSFEFWDLWRNEFNNLDITSKILLGVSLSGGVVSSREFQNNSIRIAPNLILLGRRGLGKTIRGMLVNSLWRNPTEFLYFPNTTEAFITNVLPISKSFIFVDELMWSGEKERERLLYNMVSLRGRKTAIQEFPSLYCSFLITGEIRNVDRFAGGLERRYLVLIMEEEEKKKNELIIRMLKKLTDNYGFVWEFINNLDRDFITKVNVRFRERLKDFKGELEEHFWFMCLYSYLVEKFEEFLGVEKERDLLDEFLRKYEYSKIEFEEDKSAVNYLKALFLQCVDLLKKSKKVDLSMVVQNFQGYKSIDDRIAKLVLCDEMPYFISSKKHHYYLTRNNIFIYLNEERIDKEELKTRIVLSWNKKKKELEELKMRAEEKLLVAKLWAEFLQGALPEDFEISERAIEKIENLIAIEKEDLELEEEV